MAPRQQRARVAQRRQPSQPWPFGGRVTLVPSYLRSHRAVGRQGARTCSCRMCSCPPATCSTHGCHRVAAGRRGADSRPDHHLHAQSLEEGGHRAAWQNQLGSCARANPTPGTMADGAGTAPIEHQRRAQAGTNLAGRVGAELDWASAIRPGWQDVCRCQSLRRWRGNQTRLELMPSL